MKRLLGKRPPCEDKVFNQCPPYRHFKGVHIVSISRLACAGRLKSQVALITGASSGIGKGIAMAMADEGALIVVNYIGQADAAREVVGEIERKNTRVIAVEADVSNEDQVRRMFGKAIKEFGTVDILINNAGIQRDAAFDTMTLDDWQKVIDVNLTGAFLCSREAVIEFKRRGSSPKSRSVRERLYSSARCIRLFPGLITVIMQYPRGYKSAHESMAQELAPDRIRVNSIAPGAIKTSINKKSWKTLKRPALFSSSSHGAVLGIRWISVLLQSGLHLMSRIMFTVRHYL